MKKIQLKLNKEVITQLDKIEMKHVAGGKEEFLSIFGSNCKQTDPLRNQCYAGTPTPQVSYDTVTSTTPGSCCYC
ncbi:MAG: class I lanthipeptide [Chitinophagaceae bacterium]